MSTKIRKESIKDKGVVASVMTHSEKTADIHYAQTAKNESEAAGGAAIRKMFSGITERQEPPSPRRWTDEEVIQLKNVFGENPTLEVIRDNLHQLPNIDATPKKIYDKFKRIERDTKQKRQIAATQAKIEQLIPGENSRSRKFSKNEAKLICIHCKHLVLNGGINEISVTNALKETDLLMRYDWMQVRSRICYERFKTCKKKKKQSIKYTSSCVACITETIIFIMINFDQVIKVTEPEF